MTPERRKQLLVAAKTNVDRAYDKSQAIKPSSATVDAILSLQLAMYQIIQVLNDSD